MNKCKHPTMNAKHKLDVSSRCQHILPCLFLFNSKSTKKTKKKNTEFARNPVNVKNWWHTKWARVCVCEVPSRSRPRPMVRMRPSCLFCMVLYHFCVEIVSTDKVLSAIALPLFIVDRHRKSRTEMCNVCRRDVSDDHVEMVSPLPSLD